MACQITGKLLDMVQTPLSGITVTATPSTGFLELVSGTWSDVATGSRSTTTDSSGIFTFTLPFPSVCNPIPTWTITSPLDGFLLFSGVVPEGQAGPLTLKTLCDTYHWNAV
jgi:hypothetical protein